MADTYAYDRDLPCKNPYCKSHGRPHPNCKCYNSGFSAEQGQYAQGGQICEGPHKENCEHFADGGTIQENHEFINNPMKTLDQVGAHHGLHHLLTKVGHNGRSENQFKHLEEYKDSAKRGKKTIDGHMSDFIGPKKPEIKHDQDGINQLKQHLNNLQVHPDQALNVGGNLGQTAPDHAAALGMKTANAMNYLQSIKPMASQGGPLDPLEPVSKAKENQYDRQLAIAQNPMQVLHRVKNGTILPQDLKTLHNVYPELGRSIISKASDAIIDAKSKNMKIPYKQKQGLSMLLGQPLDFIQTPQAMQAIIKANSPMQAPQSQGKPKKATQVELNQINKVDEQLATPDQKRLMGKS